MKKIATTTPDTSRLYDIEVKALRMVRGDDKMKQEPGGAWFNTCCERLKSGGYLNWDQGYKLTHKGHQFLEQLDG